jgi:hypothetical protein
MNNEHTSNPNNNNNLDISSSEIDRPDFINDMQSEEFDNNSSPEIMTPNETVKPVETVTQNETVKPVEAVTQNETVKPVEAVQPDEITLKIDKSTLASLCQNLNSNLLVNCVAYTGIITKLKDTSNTPEQKASLEADLNQLEIIQQYSADLMKSIQLHLGLSEDKVIEPLAIIKEASKSSSLADQLISTQVASILASLAAAAVLIGGKKQRRISRKRGKKHRQKYTMKKDA